jgi:hypothetical protein
MTSFDDLPILAEAEWLHDGHVPVRLRVHASPMVYGIGDYEDPADLAEERPGNVYIVSSDRPGEPGVVGTVVADLASIEDVLATVAAQFPGARWLRPLAGA